MLNAGEALSELIATATSKALSELFSNGEHFYYVTLTTIAEGYRPTLSAWSWEALERESATFPDVDDARADIKWSYSDSPYFDFGADYFLTVEQFLAGRVRFEDAGAKEWDAELQFRLSAMEKALAKLDHEGLFGVGTDREKIVVNAELAPPDVGNTERAKRLNPPSALVEWLDEAAE